MIPHTVVVLYINTMKTTFYLNFDFYQVIKQQRHHSHLNKEKLSINDSKKFVVRFRFYWRPPEGFYFHWRGFKKCFLQFKTLHRVIYIPLEGFRCPSWRVIIALEGFSYPSWGVIIPLEEFRYPSYGFIIPLEGFRYPS